MRKLRRAFLRLAGHFRKPYREREMADEFESHFQMHIEDNLRAGMSAGEAHRQAALKFGGVAYAQEEVREMSTIMWLETTFRDVQYAVRGLRRNPGFAITAIVSLTLGIGASLSIFAVADGLLLRPLPFREPDRIVMVWERNYGVLAYSVTERTREIGVRMALGAEPGRITALVIAGAVSIVLPGIVAGVAGALALTGLLRSLLFGVKPHDAPTFVMASVVLAAVALVAAYVPARRASRLMPLDALRME
jgi:hypothetical protein